MLLLLYRGSTAVAPPTPPPGTPTLSTGRVQLARYVCEVSWDTYASGFLTLGTSTLGGADTFGVTTQDPVFSGPFDDLSSMFLEAEFSRGRSQAEATTEAGVGTVVLRDPTAILNPENVASPLYGKLEQRRQPIRISAVYDGVTYPLMYQFVQRIEWTPRSRGGGIATLLTADLTAWLDESRPVIAATGPTTTGAAIGLVLDAIGWIDPSARQLDTGDSIPDFSADGTETATQLITGLLEAERGVFYVNAAGVPVYESRLARTTRPVIASIVDLMTNAVPGVDHQIVRNRVRVERSQTGYIGVAENTTSVTKRGPLDHPTITTPYLDSDSLTESLASFILASLVSPRPPMQDVQIDNRIPGLFEHALGRDLLDVLNLREAAGGSQGDYQIERVNHRITPGSHKTSWLVTRKSTNKPFKIGVDQIVADGAAGAVLVY